MTFSELTDWKIYDLSAIAAGETIRIGDHIGLSVKKHRSSKITVVDVPLWDCQSIQLKREVPPQALYEEIKSIKADVIGMSIKEPIMRDLFGLYASYLRGKAGYVREISPRILRVDVKLGDIWGKNLDKKARNAVRRAERSGVKVESIDPADHVDEIYECNRSKRGVPPCYTDKKCILEEIEENKKKFRGNFHALGAFLHDKLVGYAYIIFVNRDLAIFSKFFINYNFRNISIGEMLLWSGIKAAADRGVKFLQYGSWSKYHSGLDMFLEHFGFSRGFRTINFYIPLTPVGGMFLLQKRIFSRIISSDLLIRLSQNRFLRDRWYLFKSLRRKLT
ncbi:MAG: GNAT family N-acetyltransferase [Candidatus Methanodesulfokora sp.]